MKYGFDLDGTLDLPAIAEVARGLHARGHEIHVITGGLRDEGEWTMEARIAKMKAIDVPYTRIHRCFGDDFGGIAAEKRRVCKELGVVLMFEDSPDYTSETQKVVRTLLIHYQPGGLL